MRSIDRVRRRLALCIAALPAACAAPRFVPSPATAISAPMVRVGDRWRYDVRDGYSGQRTAVVTQTVTEAAPRLRIGSTDADGRNLGEEIYADPWRVIEERFFDLPQVYEAPVSLLPTPLQAGVRRDASLYYEVPSYRPRRYWWSQTLRSLGWERLTTGAGEFDCLVIERQIAFEHSDVFRMFCSRREQLWYAPRVNRWTRRQWTGRYATAGGRYTWSREDFVVWTLLDYVPAPVAAQG
jgi:hypothetical protein